MGSIVVDGAVAAVMKMQKNESNGREGRIDEEMSEPRAKQRERSRNIRKKKMTRAPHPTKMRRGDCLFFAFAVAAGVAVARA